MTVIVSVAGAFPIRAGDWRETSICSAATTETIT